MQRSTKRKNGINGESTFGEQLESVILPELKERLLKRIEVNNLPIQSERYLNSFAYAFKVKGLNMDTLSGLFIKLTEINNNYGHIRIIVLAKLISSTLNTLKRGHIVSAGVAFFLYPCLTICTIQCGTIEPTI